MKLPGATARAAAQSVITVKADGSLRCPRCGASGSWDAEDQRAGGVIMISCEEIAGAYCLRCFAHALALEVPKMEEIGDAGLPGLSNAG